MESDMFCKLTPQDLKLLLQEQIAAAENAVTALNCTSKLLNPHPECDGLPADPVLREAVKELYESSYTVLRQTARAKELLCYEEGTAKQLRCSLSKPIRRFANQLAQLIGTMNRVHVNEVDSGLCADIDPNRLTFLLLLAALELLSTGSPEDTLSVSAGISEGCVQIELLLETADDSEMLEIPCPMVDQLIMQRFCVTYHARIFRVKRAGKRSLLIELPQKDAGDGGVLRVSSDKKPYEESVFSVYRVLLSEILPVTDDLFAGKPEFDDRYTL